MCVVPNYPPVFVDCAGCGCYLPILLYSPDAIGGLIALTAFVILVDVRYTDCQILPHVVVIHLRFPTRC